MTDTDLPVLVIYHADCLDGFAAAWAAYCQFGDKAHYKATRFGDKFPAFIDGTRIYMVDFAFAPDLMVTAAKTAGQIIVIDHHLTAQDSYNAYFASQTCPDNLHLHFDLSRSGCVLTWQYFFPTMAIPPLLLHIEDRDLWRFELAGTQEITSALYEQMPLAFNRFGQQSLADLRAVGKVQVAQFTKMVKRLSQSAHPVKIAGHTGLAVNAPSFFASELGHLLAQKSGTFGMTYHYDGRKKHWLFGLRSVGECNVGHIAQEFGGGGHVNAAGFSLPNNPFLTLKNGTSFLSTKSTKSTKK